MITLVVGGTRSGKSAIAERLAAATRAPVTYLATARIDSGDVDHRRRIDAHQARRPHEWVTIECPSPTDLLDALATTGGTVLVDSLGTWLTNHPSLEADPEPLAAALVARTGHTIVVSEEVGLSIHAPTEMGRRYVDALGSINQAVGAVAARVLLVVAGRVVELGEFVESRQDEG